MHSPSMQRALVQRMMSAEQFQEKQGVYAQPKPGTCHSVAMFAAVPSNECFDSSWAVVPAAILLKQQ